MAAVELKRAGPLAYREVAAAEPSGKPPVVAVHGFPESSLMWEPLMEQLSAAGHGCIAPDLYNLGDSEEAGPATFERVLEAFTAFMDEQAPGEVLLVVHDWGGFIGLAWACDHPEQVAGMVISDTGFFSDGRWHGLADAVRGPEGEGFVNGIDRAAFKAMLGDAGFGDAEIEAYWRPFEEGRGRRATLDFYRSMDFEKLTRWDGKLEQIDAPTLILWGETDPFAALAGARRFHRELPGSNLVVVEGAGHFVWDEEPRRCAEEVLSFLGSSF